MYHKTMGRPTNEPKQHILRVRVGEDLKGDLVRKAELQGISLSEAIRSALEAPQTIQHEIHTPQNEIRNMCDWFGISTEDFYRQIYELFLSGKITVEEGKVVFHEQ